METILMRKNVLYEKVKERIQTCVFMLIKIVEKVSLHLNKDQKRI